MFPRRLEEAILVERERRLDDAILVEGERRLDEAILVERQIHTEREREMKQFVGMK